MAFGCFCFNQTLLFGFQLVQQSLGLLLFRFDFTKARHAFSLGTGRTPGDVRAGSVKRVAAAVGEGAAVVSQIHQYPASRQPVLPLPPEESHAPALHA
ncbi:hypothetical protein ABW45_08275 [Stenotrophomonas maltophilia]|nr:hypothetical protein ABW45_08275 [Stenotrophomonas maltophilia]